MKAKPERRAPANLEALRASILADFERACSTLYMIKPRASAHLDAEDVDDEGQEHRPVEAGLKLLELWTEQRQLARKAAAMRAAGQPVRILKVKPRQAGDSTLGCAWTFHHTYWQPRQCGLIVAHHETTTNRLYNIVKTFAEELPAELQEPQDKKNRRELSWLPPLGATILAQTAGFIDIGHGLTVEHALFSEIDRWADPDTVLDGVMETIPMAPNTSIIIESVVERAGGWLENFWKASVRGETGFLPLFTPWYRVPEYRLAVGPEFERTKEEDAWVAEYGITDEQVAWYRAKMSYFRAKEPWGGERKMRRLYPFTAEEAFQQSGFCIFPDAVLARQDRLVQPPIETIQLVSTGGPDFVEAATEDVASANLLVWRRPEADAYYSIGVDIGEGVGQSESVISVVRWPGYEQVAEWASDRVSPEETAFATRYLAEKWGGPNALVIPEINKNGPLIIYILQSLPGTFGIFRWRYLDRPGLPETATPQLGWQTTSATKQILAQVANLVMLRGQVSGDGIVRSSVLLDQMRRCVDVLPNIRWRALGGKSDRIIAYLIALVGAYLEFEGGNVNGMVSINTVAPSSRRDQEDRPAGSYDMADEVFGDHAPAGAFNPYWLEDAP